MGDGFALYGGGGFHFHVELLFFREASEDRGIF